MSAGQGEIHLLGEMSAKRTKGSAVFAEEAVSGEERYRGVAPAESNMSDDVY